MNWTDNKQQDELLAELKAIDYWDREYHAQSKHEAFEQQAYKSRQERRREITFAIRKG